MAYPAIPIRVNTDPSELVVSRWDQKIRFAHELLIRMVCNMLGFEAGIMEIQDPNMSDFVRRKTLCL